MTERSPMSLSPLAPRLQRILDAEYPRYSAPEMARRRAAVEAAMAQAGCDHLVFCGANRAGSVVQWLTQWPVTAEAVGVLTPGQPGRAVPAIRQPPAAGEEARRPGRGRVGRRVLDRRRHRGAGQARRARRPRRRHRAAEFRAARGAVGTLRQGREPQPRLCAAAPRQVGGGDRLAHHRRLAQRPRHGGSARRAPSRGSTSASSAT